MGITPADAPTSQWLRRSLSASRAMARRSEKRVAVLAVTIGILPMRHLAKCAISMIR